MRVLAATNGPRQYVVQYSGRWLIMLRGSWSHSKVSNRVLRLIAMGLELEFRAKPDRKSLTVIPVLPFRSEFKPTSDRAKSGHNLCFVAQQREVRTPGFTFWFEISAHLISQSWRIGCSRVRLDRYPVSRDIRITVVSTYLWNNKKKCSFAPSPNFRVPYIYCEILTSKKFISHLHNNWPKRRGCQKYLVRFFKIRLPNAVIERPYETA